MANFIHIGEQSREDGISRQLGYEDITSKLLNEIVKDDRIRWIQINKKLPDRAYREIDRIFERRQDLYFRIFGIGTGENKTFDLSVLSQMPHMSRIRLDGDFTENKEAVNLAYLCELTNLKGVHLTLFDRLDYSFIRSMAKAKKHIESIGRIRSLRSLSLSGIRVENFSFLKKPNLDSFALSWCGNSDLAMLGELSGLRSLKLWRIMKLENLDFIKSLVNLESLKLKDLKHITKLPDLSGLTRLKEIQIDNVPVNLETMDESVRKLVHS